MTSPRTPGPGRVLVVEPMSSGVALLRAAHDLGLETVVVSHDRDDRRLPDGVRRDIDTLLTLDTNDEPALTAAVTALHAERQLVGILPGFEFYVPVVARLAARLGLPGLPAPQAAAVRDKALMRRRVEAAGLRVPRYAPACSAAELDAAAEAVGFPCVLKPTDSAGSIHVVRVDDRAELHSAYRNLVGDPRSDLGRRLDGKILLEEYLDGPELSVEGYVTDGQVRIVAVTRKFLGPEPHFVELGHVVHADLTPSVRRAVDAYVTAVVAALGVTVGPFHCELRLPGGAPVLIELAARMGGDRIPQLVEIASGVPLAHLAVAAHTGLGPDAVPVRSPRAKFAGIHFLTAPGLDRYRAVHGLDTLRGRPDVLAAELYLRPGETIPPATDFRCRLGHVLFTADSYADALEVRRLIDLGVSFE
ncbi:ATP-grasp domain-containing protein [Kitasatospora mediocidica]|uniref:ATP-grasp domain-containing protein n=1 Tax=Kitasatospora mediocidica TaxID=58352 RepID=UPI00068CA28B|nr:ATP-grasp domain-containing protein [Kitasatospora mediocidica]